MESLLSWNITRLGKHYRLQIFKQEQLEASAQLSSVWQSLQCSSVSETKLLTNPSRAANFTRKMFKTHWHHQHQGNYDHGRTHPFSRLPSLFYELDNWNFCRRKISTTLMWFTSKHHGVLLSPQLGATITRFRPLNSASNSNAAGQHSVASLTFSHSVLELTFSKSSSHFDNSFEITLRKRRARPIPNSYWESLFQSGKKLVEEDNHGLQSVPISHSTKA